MVKFFEQVARGIGVNGRRGRFKLLKRNGNVPEIFRNVGILNIEIPAEETTFEKVDDVELLEQPPFSRCSILFFNSAASIFISKT